jgi:Flp pilus assembly protein TadG
MRLPRLKRDVRGTSAIEFALLAPVFLLMLFGLIDFGRACWMISSLDFALGSAGRYAMLHTGATGDEVIAQAQAHLYGINAGSVAFAATTSLAQGINYLTVQAQCPFTFLPLMPAPSMTLTRRVSVPLLP